jgi:hypothetical protein
LDRVSGAESGLWEIREVALVSSSPAPEVCPAEHALTKTRNNQLKEES